jgi:hypothetical protein
MLRKARQRQVDSTDERLFARTIPQEESTHHDPAVRFERNSKRLSVGGLFRVQCSCFSWLYLSSD